MSSQNASSFKSFGIKTASGKMVVNSLEKVTIAGKQRSDQESHQVTTDRIRADVTTEKKTLKKE